jgi:hypothetical protein
VVDKCDDCKQLTMGLPKVAANLKVGRCLSRAAGHHYTCQLYMHTALPLCSLPSGSMTDHQLHALPLPMTHPVLVPARVSRQ